MFCQKCGAQNDEGALNCSQCGNDLKGAPAAPAGAPPREHVPNYLVPAILTTLFCCLPFGIVAIVFAAQVNGKLQAGDYAGARAASGNAKMWSWISLGLGLALTLLIFGMILLGALAGQ